MFNKSPKSVNRLALEYMERKYGEKFEYVKPAGNSMTGTRNFIASCSSHGHVLVQVDNFKDEEKRVFRDNHIAVKYEEKTREYIKEISDKEFTETKVLYSAAEKALSEDLPGNATFEQFLADPESRIFAVIAVKKVIIRIMLSLRQSLKQYRRQVPQMRLVCIFMWLRKVNLVLLIEIRVRKLLLVRNILNTRIFIGKTAKRN